MTYSEACLCVLDPQLRPVSQVTPYHFDSTAVAVSHSRVQAEPRPAAEATGSGVGRLDAARVVVVVAAVEAGAVEAGAVERDVAAGLR